MFKNKCLIHYSTNNNNTQNANTPKHALDKGHTTRNNAFPFTLTWPNKFFKHLVVAWLCSNDWGRLNAPTFLKPHFDIHVQYTNKQSRAPCR